MNCWPTSPNCKDTAANPTGLPSLAVRRSLLRGRRLARPAPVCIALCSPAGPIPYPSTAATLPSTCHRAIIVPNSIGTGVFVQNDPRPLFLAQLPTPNFDLRLVYRVSASLTTDTCPLPPGPLLCLADRGQSVRLGDVCACTLRRKGRFFRHIARQQNLEGGRRGAEQSPWPCDTLDYEHRCAEHEGGVENRKAATQKKEAGDALARRGCGGGVRKRRTLPPKNRPVEGGS